MSFEAAKRQRLEARPEVSLDEDRPPCSYVSDDEVESVEQIRVPKPQVDCKEGDEAEDEVAA